MLGSQGGREGNAWQPRKLDGKSQPVVAGAPVEVQPDSLPEAFEQRRQVAVDAVPLDPQLSSSSGVKLCMYQRWLARPAGSYCPNY